MIINDQWEKDINILRTELNPRWLELNIGDFYAWTPSFLYNKGRDSGSHCFKRCSIKINNVHVTTLTLAKGAAIIRISRQVLCILGNFLHI